MDFNSEKDMDMLGLTWYEALGPHSRNFSGKFLEDFLSWKKSYENIWQNSNCKLGNSKNAQLSLTNPRDAKACQKLLHFDVKTSCLAFA